MKNSLLVSFLLLPLFCFSQTNYYRYNSAGVPEKIGYSEENKPIEFSPYHGIDADLYTRVGLAKQQAFNDNVVRVQQAINDAGTAIKQLRRVNAEQANIIDKGVSETIEIINRKKYDYSNAQIASYVIGLFIDYKNLANECIINELEKRK